MSYAPTPPPYEQPGYAPKKGKPWLLIVAGLVLLVSLVLCGIGALNVFSTMKDLADQPMQTGTQTVQLDEGESTDVWVDQATGGSCTATAPDGSPIRSSSTVTQDVAWGDKELTRAMTFEATQSGDHTISCTTPFVVGKGISMGGSALTFVGGALCCLGSVLAIIGLVLWLVRRKQ